MSFITISEDELNQTATSTLCEMYHHAQLAAVACMVNEDCDGALYWLNLTLLCRGIVMRRHRAPDQGHIDFYNKVGTERDNVELYMYSQGYNQFKFACGELVGNAIDAGVDVPRVMYPVGWSYNRYLAGY